MEGSKWEEERGGEESSWTGRVVSTENLGSIGPNVTFAACGKHHLSRFVVGIK